MYAGGQSQTNIRHLRESVNMNESKEQMNKLNNASYKVFFEIKINFYE
jgi:hypothetical protein